MNDFDFVRKLGVMYENILKLRRDEDYEINPVQMEKLVQVTGFFLDAAKKLDGEVEPVHLSPREEHSGVTARFPIFDIAGNDIQWFCDVMQHCSAIGIDPTADGGVCVSCTVPYVFVKKEEQA